MSKQVKDLVEAVHKNFVEFIRERVATPPKLALNVDPACMYWVPCWREWECEYEYWTA